MKVILLAVIIPTTLTTVFCIILITVCGLVLWKKKKNGEF